MADFFVLVFMFGVVGCLFGVWLLVEFMVGGVVEDQDLLAEVGDDRIAEGGDADGADVAYEEHDQEGGLGAVAAVESGGDHGAEDDVAWVENGEEEVSAGVLEFEEEAHQGQSGDGPEDSKGGVVA